MSRPGLDRAVVEARPNSAFRMCWPNEQFTADPAATLFVVQCEHCGERCGGYSDFPLVKAADFRDCSWSLELGAMAPSMPWSAFEGIIERARSLYHDPKLELVPNSGLGPMRIRPLGRSPQKLNDIELALPGGMLFSERLINLLSAKGMDLKSAVVSLRDSQGEAYSYGLVQASIARSLHSDMFVEYPNYRQCARCGTVKVLRPLRGKLEKLILDRTHRDEVQPVFRVMGFLRSVFLSDRLKSALDAIMPSGYQAEEFGNWR